MLQQVQRCRVEPLQIVEEQRQRVLRPGEHGEKAPENQLKAALRVTGRQLRDRWLVTYDELQLRNQVYDKPPVWAQCFAKSLAPSSQLWIALAKQWSDQALKGLRQGRIGDVTLVLVELACCEEPARLNKHSMQFIDDRGFADAGISGDKHQLRRAVVDYAVEAGEQGLYLARPSVQLLGKQQPIGRVVFAKREGVDVPFTLLFGKTVLKITLDASCSLVTLLGGLREQLHDDFGDRNGDILRPFTGRQRLSGDMAVHPLHRIGRGERQGAREHLVERDAERIEVAAGIDRTIHPSGLFGRHVSECTGDSLRRLGLLSLTRHA